MSSSPPSRESEEDQLVLIGDRDSEGRLLFGGVSFQGRIPERIIEAVIRDNEWWLIPESVALLRQLQAQLRSLECSPSALPLSQPSQEDPLWSAFCRWYRLDWSQIPWLHGEIFLYRLLLSLAHGSPDRPSLLDPPPCSPDIFALQKQSATTQALPAMAQLLLASHSDLADARPRFRHHLLASLWGNQADLALFSVTEAGMARQRHLLIDHVDNIYDHLVQAKRETEETQVLVDFVLDNSGMELFSDLLLCRHLLGSGLCTRVRLHLKDSPFFVSDTTSEDLYWLLRCLRDQTHAPALAAFAEDIQALLLAPSGIAVTTDPFWTSPLEFRDMPAHLSQSLSQAHLSIVKGDLNYRRLVGDRHFSPHTPFSLRAGYFPASVAALRTNKSALICGLPEADQLDISQLPADWLVSGDYAVINFLLKTS